MIATSNYGEVDSATAKRYGGEWGDLVDNLRDTSIAVIGGNDLEPAWGSQDAGRAWRDGYLSSTKAELLWLPSADGCPKNGVNGACSNGWSQQGLAEVLWGTERGVVLPQIYHDGGVQAFQWAALAQTAQVAGIEPRFAGVLTQQRACSQSTDPNCPQLDIAPEVAWKQLRDALDASDSTRGLTLPHSSDIGWG